jgi:HK97 family phage major capsid protein
MCTLSKLQELQELRNDISERLLRLTGQRDLTDEDRRQIDSLNKEAIDLGDQIRRYQAVSLDADLRATVRPPNGQPGEFGPEGLPTKKRGKTWAKRREHIVLDPAFERFLRTGDKTGLKEYRDTLAGTMGIGAPVASIPTSVFVPQGFVDDVEVALKFYGELYSIARDYPTATGAPLPYPTTNDTSIEAEIVGESTEVSTQVVNIGNLVLQAWKYSTKLIQVSLELLQDSAFDLGRFVSEQCAIRLARKWEDDFINGNGTSMPRGLLASGDAKLGATAVGSAANDGSSNNGTNSIGTGDLLNLIFSVDPFYRKNGSFLMHDSTLSMLSQALDKFGRPLYTPNPQTGKIESIFGYPVKRNNYMPTLDPSSPATVPVTVLFGDFKKYLVRRVKDLTILRLVERYAEYGLVGFIGFSRMDARLIDAGTNPVKYLQQAA